MRHYHNTAVFLTAAALVWVHPQIAMSLSHTEVAAIAKEITVLIESPAPSGSGVIIGRRGDTYLVLTAAHVVNSTHPGKEADVTTHDGRAIRSSVKSRRKLRIS